MKSKKGLEGKTYGFKEDLEDTTGLFVDEAGDTLDTTTASKTTDSLQMTVSSARNVELSVRLTGLVIPWMLSRRILR